ncbi:MAG: hypothetical protein ACI4KN_08750 [Gemmiger sp.]
MTSAETKEYDERIQPHPGNRMGLCHCLGSCGQCGFSFSAAQAAADEKREQQKTEETSASAEGEEAPGWDLSGVGSDAKFPAMLGI